ncbi:hypothetical protein [Pectobacterium atrosepticum]|uniref:hypothetical protein n=1 Tax=Pectobacterium atrosepticum TaxID=29471 RepID=UPI003016572E
MNNNLTGIFASLLADPNMDRSTVSALLSGDSKKMLSPVSVRFRPGTKDLLDVMSIRLGISLSELTNMIVESTLRETFLPFNHAASSVIDRFELLMHAHELNLTDIADLLAPWNIRLSVLQDRSRTMDYLTTPLLIQLACWFFASKEWMLGHKVPPIETEGANHQWPQTEDQFNDLILNSDINKNIGVIFWKKEDSNKSYSECKTGILINKRENIAGVVFYPVLSITPCRINNEQSLWIQRAISARNTTCHVRSVTIKESQAVALEQGTTLPALIFKIL